MTTTPGFDLRTWRSGLRSQYTSLDPLAARIRAAHLGEVSRLTPHAMLANLGSLLLVLWVFGERRPAGLWLWAAFLALISALALLSWWRHRRPACR